MTEPRSSDPVIRTLEERIDSNKRRLDEITRALYGYPELGQKGFREETREELVELHQRVSETKELCEALRQERRDELAEKRGMKRVIGYTGITSLATLVSMIALLITIWQSGVFGV